LPVRVRVNPPGQKLAAGVAVALVAAGLAVGLRHVPGVAIALRAADHVLYDTLYRLRPVTDMTGGDVVIVAVDDDSLQAMKQAMDFGWPWPREFWGNIVQYADKAGARAVVFDVLFSEPSVHADELDDDEAFGRMVAQAAIPVVFATAVGRDGSVGGFAPAVPNPRFGAVNISDSEACRSYKSVVAAKNSLAREAVEAAASGAGGRGLPADEFLLHYYGPHTAGDGRFTFRYLKAAHVIGAALGEAVPEAGPEALKDKIVLVGSIAAGTFDLKRSPLSGQYPGVEVHATAIENLLRGQRVHPVGTAGTAGAALGAALLAAVGVVFPRRASLKVASGVAAAAVTVGVAFWLFGGATITWLPLAPPLLAVVVATVGAFAWSYLTEDRQRRVVLKALSQYVSPAVAEEIARDPSKLSLGGVRREMTVMFTDIQGFTNLTETMAVEDLSRMLNYYLDEMSGVVLSEHGTLDKYVGDAIMSFWNAPVEQPDHAVRACRAALGMKRREEMIRAELAKLGATGMLTRIGLNTGAMAVGNMGSSQKFNYTVLGDSVNLGSRLEGANKFYGTQILLSESTAAVVRDRFAMRQLDVLRVKGKQQPMAVYELIAEGAPDERARELIGRYERALCLYRKQRWDEAEAELRALRRAFPDDGPAAALAARIAKYRADPPPADWDGVYEAKEK
jgi:adenylate cyclase